MEGQPALCSSQRLVPQACPSALWLRFPPRSVSQPDRGLCVLSGSSPAPGSRSGGMRGSWLIPEDPGMPADARVDFAYFPTYIAVAWLILARQRHPDILQQERRLDRAIKRGLRFATGRRLMGHGYDASRELLAAVRVLALGQVFSFVREKSEFAPQFMALIEEVEDWLVNHLPTETGWSATPVSEQQQALALIRGGDREGNQVCTLAGQRWREHGADQF